MNKEYKIKLDLNKKIYNKKMTFNQFDENVNDFYIEVTKNNEVVKDLDKSIVTLVAIKPNNTVDAQFIEVKEGQIYADLKPSMCDLVGNYQAKAMIVLEGEIVTTDTINYSVNEDKIISKLNDDVVSDERFTLFTDTLARLSTIEISEEQRIVNEAERILSEENRKIEEAKRVEAELIRVHEEADRAKYDATRESNENIRKQNESIRLANETNRIDEEAKRVEEENKRKLAEEERNANYNFMTEDEERRRSEANAHKEAENLRVQAETNRVNEEAKRRTTEQARVSAENTRVSNENTREANEVVRQNNETQRVEAETQRQNRYNSFIADAEANANDFENYTNTAKVKEEERKANELDRKLQEDRRVSNEVERISNENTRKANEVIREENETSRQNVFENKVSEVDEKIVELNTTKDNFISSINTKVDNKISELDSAKSDMSNTVSNKVNEVENRFNALTSKQQQDAEVIDARDGETSLKARLDRDIEKAKQVYVNVEGNNISTDSSVGYAKDVEILGNTVQDASNLADIRSVGDTVEGQELYEIPVLSCGKNLFDGELEKGGISSSTGELTNNDSIIRSKNYIRVNSGGALSFSSNHDKADIQYVVEYDINKNFLKYTTVFGKLTLSDQTKYIKFRSQTNGTNSYTLPNDYKTVKIQIEESTQATPYEPYQEDKLTILSPVQLERVGDVADRIIEKDGVWGVEKNVVTYHLKDFTHSNYVGFSCRTVLPTQSTDDVNWKGIDFYSNLGYFHTDVNSQWNNRTINSIAINNVDSSAVCDITSENYIYEDVVKMIEDNDIWAKFVTKSPQFIPLPHDQQVKLRTFANKTNISFLTEIEGTIKAQVPKSIGATVNTHTEQINNLNKELDRVKKLEESTVSTVETESDFTTVEATSNGYFEDVKLEGKTLVNLWKHEHSIPDYVTFDKGTQIYTLKCDRDNIWVQFRTKFNSMLKTSTTYTFAFDILENTATTKTNFDAGSYSNLSQFKPKDFYIQPGYVGRYIYIATTKDSFENCTNMNMIQFGQEPSGAFIKFRVLWILEGDHTQNPPSYFEGLKSVGDGADEIVVESVKGDGNLFDGEFERGSINFNTGICYENNYRIRSKNFNRIIGDCYVTITGELTANPANAILCYDSSKNYIDRIYLSNLQNIKLPKNAHYFKLAIFEDNNIIVPLDIKISVYKGTTPKPYTPHQSDKKRLLFYNEETQAWEKPILREWDSIEKHANGKYYYHQRSGEVVLNGSEKGWGGTGNTFENAIEVSCSSVNIGKLNHICDILQKGNTLNSFRSASDGSIVIKLSKSILSTPDTAGVKQWLQTNNVTVVYQLAQEKVYECTNIDLITYNGETNFIVESGAIVPKTTLKVHNNISNVVSLLQKKVSLLESNITSYMITQNRLMLASRYNADTVSFKVDVATLRNSFEYDNDLYELILNNILVGKDNYNREYIENLIIFYWMDFVISDEMYITLFEIIEEQHNPKVIETPLI